MMPDTLLKELISRMERELDKRDSTCTRINQRIEFIGKDDFYICRQGIGEYFDNILDILAKHYDRGYIIKLLGNNSIHLTFYERGAIRVFLKVKDEIIEEIDKLFEK